MKAPTLDAKALKAFINNRLTTPVNDSWITEEGETVPYTNAEQTAYNNLFLTFKPDPNYQSDF